MNEPAQPQRPDYPPPYGAAPPGASAPGDPAAAGGPAYGAPPHGNQGYGAYGNQGYAPPPGYGTPAAYGTPPAYGAPPPAYGAPPPAYGSPGSGPPRTDDTVWGVLAHLSLFVFALIAPLVIYLVFKDTSTFARHHAAEALNFHLTLLIAVLVSIPLVFVLIGIPLLFGIAIASCVFAILAAVAAGRREPYRYPLTIHFVS